MPDAVSCLTWFERTAMILKDTLFRGKLSLTFAVCLVQIHLLMSDVGLSGAERKFLGTGTTVQWPVGDAPTVAMSLAPAHRPMRLIIPTITKRRRRRSPRQICLEQKIRATRDPGNELLIHYRLSIFKSIHDTQPDSISHRLSDIINPAAALVRVCPCGCGQEGHSEGYSSSGTLTSRIRPVLPPGELSNN